MTNRNANQSVYDTTIRLFILILIVAWCLLIMYPFVSIILWSLILAMALHPLHKSLSGKDGRKTQTGLNHYSYFHSWYYRHTSHMACLLSSLVDEVKELKASFDSGTLTIPPPSGKVKEWPIIGEKLYDNWLSCIC